MTSRIRLPLFVLTVAALLPVAARAAGIRVENYSNDPIYVAQAHLHGRLISHGWVKIAPNDGANFTASDAEDLYLRVQDANGAELTFGGFNTFKSFLTAAEKFSVSNEPDDNDVRTLRRDGSDPINIRKNEAPPDGWGTSRYFRIAGGGADKLIVNPK